MHLLIIGGNGFIGRHFVDRAVADGHHVTIVSRSRGPERTGVTQLTGGIEALCEAPEILDRIDTVCHCASMSIPASSAADPIGDITGNLQPLLLLLDTMRQRGLRRIVFLSSGGAVYGIPRSMPIPEDHACAPISPYGITKLAMENYLAFYQAQYGFKPVIIRPANPYGPGQGKVGQLGVVWTFLRMLQEGKTATLFGDGSTRRDFVYIDDLCDLMMRAVCSDVVGAFNCGGGGSGTELNELINTLHTVTGQTLDVLHEPARAIDPPAIVLDINRAAVELGWTPRVSLSDGVHKIVAKM
ncbi:NAD-dependent epimerase/dehydratase family protein [Parasedimentitalea huanghaiensis]|nr:NAD-dependent epimerase/dehydratase family protein [Zongyanglinia huanghaiensis]